MVKIMDRLSLTTVCQAYSRLPSTVDVNDTGSHCLQTFFNVTSIVATWSHSTLCHWATIFLLQVINHFTDKCKDVIGPPLEQLLVEGVILSCHGSAVPGKYAQVRVLISHLTVFDRRLFPPPCVLRALHDRRR